MKLTPYKDMAFTRNPHPARGPEVLSLDELRRYIRLFWKDPAYGMCNVPGATAAFIRACEGQLGHFKQVFISDPPQLEFLSARLQRRVSKHVLNVIQGKVYYLTDPKNHQRAIGVYNPNGTPIEGVPPFKREVRYTLRNTSFGPRVTRVPVI